MWPPFAVSRGTPAVTGFQRFFTEGIHILLLVIANARNRPAERAFLVLFCTRNPTGLNKTTTLLPLACIAQLLCAAVNVQAQPGQKELPLVGAGAGLTLFRGDVGSSNSTGGAFRSGFRFGIEQRFLNTLGAEAYSVYGTLTANERSLAFNRNFTTKFLSVGGGLMLNFDNDFFLPRRAPLSPYIGLGCMWMRFDPYGDLKAANDSTYHYWSDGSIRDVSEHAPNAPLIAHYLSRDYTYETRLTDSAVNYKRSTMGIPLSVGTKFKFTRHAGADFRASYNFTFTDYIDNTKFDRSDGWLYMSLSLYYQFHTSGKEKGHNHNADSDNDGVRDADDLCAGTPPGVKVDRHGCPPDSDGDGVPDYRDKQPDTPKNTPVDADGVAKTNKPDCIPAQFRAADRDHNCTITADEINEVIDDFFDGEGGWDAEKINALIDYFFEQ